MKEDPAGKAKEVPAEKQESEGDMLSLGLQPGMPQRKEDTKGNRGDENQMRMKSRSNSEDRDDQHTFSRAKRAQKIESSEKMLGEREERR